MTCYYETVLQSSQISEARKAELLRLHKPHHALCGSAARRADDPDWWNRERFRLHREAAERDARQRQNGGASR